MASLRNPSIWRIAVLLGMALTIRVVIAYWWQLRLPPGDRFGFGDSESYWVLAQSIARGGPLQYGPGGPLIFRTPGYPILLAPLFWLWADPPVMGARLEGAILGTLAVGLVICLARALFSVRAGYVAGLAAALYPGAVGSSVFVLSEAPYSPLLMAQLCCWVAAWRAAEWRTLSIWAVTAGVAGGAATLMRPSHLLFTPFALSVAMLLPGRRRNIVIGGLMLCSLAATMTPWWIRNYGLTGRFVATTLQLGASLYDGLNPNATGASDMQFVSGFIEAQRREDAASPAAATGTFEERLDARMRSAAVAWSLAHPGRVAQLMAIKLGRMWSPLPNAAEFQSWLFRLGIFVTYSPLLLAAMASGWRHLRRGWPYLLCLLPAIYLTLLHMVFVSSLRYREPAMLAIIVLASGLRQPGSPQSGE